MPKLFLFPLPTLDDEINDVAKHSPPQTDEPRLTLGVTNLELAKFSVYDPDGRRFTKRAPRDAGRRRPSPKKPRVKPTPPAA